MNSTRLSLRDDAAAVFSDHRADYFAQLVAPMDDMWRTFADMAAPHALMAGDEVAGSCCIDEERRLLRFWVEPRLQQHAVAFLRLALGELAAKSMIVCTLDPGYLSPALDVSSSVTSHSLLFASVSEPERPGLEGLVEAKPGDYARILEFQSAAVGAPTSFLEGYIRERLERREMWLFEDDAQLVSVGEMRRDPQQAGIAHVGLIVGVEKRGLGIGSRMLSSLVALSRDEGLEPYCSTECSNLGARRAIERAGFRANHRVLSVEFTL